MRLAFPIGHTTFEIKGPNWHVSPGPAAGGDHDRNRRLKSRYHAWYREGMLKAYVGVMSKDGLAVIQPERDESLSLVRRKLRSEFDRVGFWAVLDDTEARCVQALVTGGLRREAMMFLDRSAKEMGRILPSTLRSSLH